MGRKRVFGVVSVLFFLFAAGMGISGTMSALSAIKGGLVEIPAAMRRESSPAFVEVLRTFPAQSLGYALFFYGWLVSLSISSFFSAFVFYRLGALLGKLRLDLEGTLREAKRFSQLARLLFAIYVLNGASFLLSQQVLSFHANPGQMTSGSIGVESDPLFQMLIPQFGGASALAFSLLLLIASQISRAYSVSSREAETLRNQADLTI